MYSPDSIELLRKSGIDFQRHEEQGINPNDFAELMITSGLVLSPETTWISFHRCVYRHPSHHHILMFNGLSGMTSATSSMLAEPKLIHQALQFNMRAGHLPEPTSDGDRFLHIPLKIPPALL